MFWTRVCPGWPEKNNGISLCGLPTEHTAFSSIFRKAREAHSLPFTIQLNLLTGTHSPPALLVISGHLSLPEAVSGLQQVQCYISQQTNGDNHALCKFFPWGCFLFHRPACVTCFIFLIHFCSSLSHTVPHLFLWVGVSGQQISVVPGSGSPEALDGFYLCALISRPQSEHDDSAYLTGFLWNQSINN